MIKYRKKIFYVIYINPQNRSLKYFYFPYIICPPMVDLPASKKNKEIVKLFTI